MGDYTNFIVKVDGEEIEFSHAAKSVREFRELEDEVIYDVFESQSINKNEISSVRLNPRVYALGYLEAFGRTHRDLTDLWNWVDSLLDEERDVLLRKYK